MIEMNTVSLEAARRLIDFKGSSLSESLAEQQLEGAVALHNILAREGFAYLADEVGMGKTYVALGVLGLMRFCNPGMRVLVIAPRENIQDKWIKELKNFTRTNWRQADQRVRAVDGSPVARIARCGNLEDWAEQAVRDPDRDFFLRLSSFSLPLGGSSESWRAKRDRLRSLLPEADAGLFSLQSKEAFKRNYARAINALLPHYDLVIVDEAHNLKHGTSSGAARNSVLRTVLGLDSDVPKRDWKHYGPRLGRVLLLSATPLETDYTELWNQIDIFGKGDSVEDLTSKEVADDEKKEIVGTFMIRRLTSLSIAGQAHTKNMYRREWRGGGCSEHDLPLEIPDDRQRLIVALVQKKVSEILNDSRFTPSFQIGMLSSFESFLETTKTKQASDAGEAMAAPGTFDGEQTEDLAEREGIDTSSVNGIARSYQRKFGESLPHPKMDALAASLGNALGTGRKSLVFVRRVRSVTELQEKLCRAYDEWLRAHLRSLLTPKLHDELDEIWSQYLAERTARRVSGAGTGALGNGHTVDSPIAADGELDVDAVTESDSGGDDTFFAWFFRGEGPRGRLSGAAFRKNRLQGESSPYSTMFEENYVLELLGEGDDVVQRFADEIARDREDAVAELRARAFAAFEFTSRQKKFPRLRVYHAYQVAALAMLAEQGSGRRELAETMLGVRYGDRRPDAAQKVPDSFPNGAELLAARTFFTELRRRSALRGAIWPEATAVDTAERFTDRERRRELIASVIRLGHTFISLWATLVNRIGSLAQGAQERSADDQAGAFIDEFLGLLEQEQREPTNEFTAYRELFEVAQHTEILFATNFPEARTLPVGSLPRLYAAALSAQTPIGGMFGGVNKRLVKQFRMPGYPFVLITTDVLQEGEDLHTFCQEIIHYGISWTPSAMEQRTGRVDRIGSLAHRRLERHTTAPGDDELLQVYYPFLPDTVEVLQVRRVFDRMNTFLRKVNRLGLSERESTQIDTMTEMVRQHRELEQIREPLESAFPVKPTDLRGSRPDIEGPRDEMRSAVGHLERLSKQLEQRIRVDWEPRSTEGARFGTIYLDVDGWLSADDQREHDSENVRQQPFALYLRAAGTGGPLLLHATSTVGRLVTRSGTQLKLMDFARSLRGAKVCEVQESEAGTYSVSIEGDILFGQHVTQLEEFMDLLRRVVEPADRLERDWELWREPSTNGRRDEPLGTFRTDLMKEATNAEV